MIFSNTFHGTTSSISSRNTSRRVFFRFPAYSASAKLIWLIAQAPLHQSTRQGMIGGLVQTFLSTRRRRRDNRRSRHVGRAGGRIILLVARRTPGHCPFDSAVDGATHMSFILSNYVLR